MLRTEHNIPQSKKYLSISLGNDKGERDVNIKLKSLQEVFEFFNNFENDININVD